MNHPIPPDADSVNQTEEDEMSAPCCPFTWVPNAALEDERLDSGAVLVLLALQSFTRAHLYCWPKINTLAKRAKLSTTTTRERLRVLEDAGYIATEHREGRPSMYTVLPPKADLMAALAEANAENDPGHLPQRGAVPTPPPAVGGSRSTELQEKKEYPLSPSVTSPKGDFPPGFAAFWALYPNRRGRKAAVKAWHKLKPGDDLRQRIYLAVAQQKGWRQWRDEGVVPHASTWLNGERWEDEEPPEPQGRGGRPTTAAARSMDAMRRVMAEAEEETP